jgi:hypothetical protein
VKGYFILLAILFVATALVRAMSLAVAFDPVRLIQGMAEIGLFGLCLAGCHGLAFDRRYSTSQAWRLVGHLTLVVGGLSVFFRYRGEGDGMPSTDLYSLGLAFLPYLLFAIPAILYGHSLREKRGDDD